MAEPGLSEIITTTLRRRQGVLRDNITNNNAVLKSLKENDAFEENESGRTILEEMFYDENDSFLRYYGGQTLNTTYNPTMTSAEFDPKQFAGSVVITGREERMNSGPEAKIKLLKGRLQALEATLENNYNADILSAGTADGGKQIGGLAIAVSKTETTGTYGGIDVSTAAGTFYRNFAFDTVTDSSGGAPGGAATTDATIKKYYDYCVINTTRGMDRTKMILAGGSHYSMFSAAMMAIQRVSDSKKANSGFRELEFQGIPVYLGGGVAYGGQSLVQTDLSYGLNTKYLKMRIYKNANMEPLPELQSINQDAKVQHVVWMGNLTASNRRVQWVMFDS